MLPMFYEFNMSIYARATAARAAKPTDTRPAWRVMAELDLLEALPVPVPVALGAPEAEPEGVPEVDGVAPLTVGMGAVPPVW